MMRSQVQTLGTNCPDPTLGVGVRVQCLYRCQHDVGTPWGARGRLSCRVVLFMDQAAEDITASELLGDQRLRLAIAF
jgi:hypothetical protein